MATPTNETHESPKERFAGSQHRIDLKQVEARLRDKSAIPATGHRQETLYKGSDASGGPTTIALFDFAEGAGLPKHVARGVVMIHVIEGHLRVIAAGEEIHLGADQMLVMNPGVEHDVFAVKRSSMLLTVSLEIKPRG